MANNNDPNNNAGPPPPPPLPPISAPVPPAGVLFPGSPDSGGVEVLPELGLSDLNEIIDLDAENQKEKEAEKIEEETALIMKLMPVRSYDDIKAKLTFHRLKPSRVEVRHNLNF